VPSEAEDGAEARRSRESHRRGRHEGAGEPITTPPAANAPTMPITAAAYDGRATRFSVHTRQASVVGRAARDVLEMIGEYGKDR
jgi:hypothetical protein